MTNTLIEDALKEFSDAELSRLLKSARQKIADLSEYMKYYEREFERRNNARKGSKVQA